jgi:hypothetical protein
MASFEVQVRLPGSKVPEVVAISPDLPAGAAVKVIIQQLAVPNLKEAKMVVSPTNRKGGTIVSQQTPVKDIPFNAKTVSMTDSKVNVLFLT